jgi:hypothetical protein
MKSVSSFVAKKHHLQLLLAFSTLVIVSCSSADESKSDLPIQESAAPMPATDVVATDDTQAPTAEVDIVSAGQKYLEIVNPVNCAVKAELAIEEANNLGNMTVDPSVLGEMQSAWGVVASTKQTAFRQMLDYTWPSNVQSEIEILAADWAKQASYYQGFADAFDLATFNYKVAAYLELPPGQGNPSLIRGLLGVGTSAETDQC